MCILFQSKADLSSFIIYQFLYIFVVLGESFRKFVFSVTSRDQHVVEISVLVGTSTACSEVLLTAPIGPGGRPLCIRVLYGLFRFLKSFHLMSPS